MTRGRRILIGLGIVVVIGGITILNLKRNPQGKPEEVRIEKIETRRLVATVRAPGRVQPAEYVNLSAQIPGRIIELAVEEGDTVEKGQLLLRLDDTQYRAAVESARAAVKSAQASLALAEARAQRSAQNLTRQKQMAEQKLVSPEAIEVAETDNKIAEAEVASSKQDVARLEAQVRAAQDDLSKTVYAAPTAGVISALNVKEGEIVMTGTMNNPGTIILTIADRSRMQVEAQVDETDVIDIKDGEEVKITVDAMPDTSFAGVVTSIAASAQIGAQAGVESATNFEVKVLFSANVTELRPGMTADVEVTTSVKDSAMAVPIAALAARDQKTLDRQKKAYEEEQSGGAGKAIARDKEGGESGGLDSIAAGKHEEKLLEGVFVVREGAAFFVPVKTGIADDTHIEIMGPVEVGQQIVTGPYKSLREMKYGAKVKPLKEKSPDKKNKGKESS